MLGFEGITNTIDPSTQKTGIVINWDKMSYGKNSLVDRAEILGKEFLTSIPGITVCIIIGKNVMESTISESQGKYYYPWFNIEKPFDKTRYLCW